MSALKNWFASRSTREQRLLIAMGIVALPVLFWLLLLRPLDAAHADALDRYRLALDRHGRIAAMTGTGEIDIAPPVVDGSLAAFLTDHAAQRALALSSAIDEGSRAQVSLANIPASEVARWIASLEADGLRIESLTLAPSADGVDVNATIGTGR